MASGRNSAVNGIELKAMDDQSKEDLHQEETAFSDDNSEASESESSPLVPTVAQVHSAPGTSASRSSSVSTSRSAQRPQLAGSSSRGTPVSSKKSFQLIDLDKIEYADADAEDEIQAEPASQESGAAALPAPDEPPRKGSPKKVTFAIEDELEHRLDDAELSMHTFGNGVSPFDPATGELTREFTREEAFEHCRKIKEHCLKTCRISSELTTMFRTLGLRARVNVSVWLRLSEASRNLLTISMRTTTQAENTLQIKDNLTRPIYEQFLRYVIKSSLRMRTICDIIVRDVEPAKRSFRNREGAITPRMVEMVGNMVTVITKLHMMMVNQAEGARQLQESLDFRQKRLTREIEYRSSSDSGEESSSRGSSWMNFRIPTRFEVIALTQRVYRFIRRTNSNQGMWRACICFQMKCIFYVVVLVASIEIIIFIYLRSRRTQQEENDVV